MVLLLTDVFLLLTQVFLWLIIGVTIWFVLTKVLPKEILRWMVLLLILIVLVLSFFRGAPADGGVLEILWRIISLPLRPLGLVTILLLFLLFGNKLKPLTRNVLLGGVLILALGSLPFVAYFLAQELEMEAIEVIRPAPDLPADSRRLIVLLGQGSTRLQLRPPKNTAPTSPPKVERPIRQETFQILTQLPIQLTEKGNNIIYAAKLFQEETSRGGRPLVVVSAGRYRDRIRKSGEKKEEISESSTIQTVLTQQFNVPATDILLDHDSLTVHDSAINVKKLLNDQRVPFGNQLMLVGSAMSMNRAYLTFQQILDEASIIARPADFHTLPASKSLARLVQGSDLVERDLGIPDFLPSADAFCLSSKAYEEYLTSLFYFLRGWIRPFQVAR